MEDRLMLDIEFVRTNEHAVLPTKAHEYDACYDLYSSENAYLYRDATIAIDTGFNIAIPAGHVGLVCSRSGFAAKNSIFVLNAPGIIDAGYRGACKVILHNAGENQVSICIGDRIGQLMLQKVLLHTVKEVEEFTSPDTSRGTKGFGSSGV